MDPIAIKTAGKSIAKVGQDQLKKQVSDKALKPEQGVSQFEQVRLNKVEEIPQQNPQVQEMQKNVKDVDSAQQVQENKAVANLKNLVKDLEKSNAQLDNLIRSVVQDGKSFSPSELMAMQAEMYKLTKEIEMTGKVVEQANQGIKTILNQQV